MTIKTMSYIYNLLLREEERNQDFLDYLEEEKNKAIAAGDFEELERIRTSKKINEKELEHVKAVIVELNQMEIKKKPFWRR